MNGVHPTLDALTRAERRALRALLIRATAVAGRGGDRPCLEALVAAAPIDALPAAAALHRVDGTVLRALDGTRGVPDDVRERLKAGRDRAALGHLLVVGALSEIGRAFDDAGLSWVVMKGPVVASLLYPDVGDRTYGDLDLLLDRRDFAAGMRVLEALDYRHTIHNWALAEVLLAGQVGLRGPLLSIDLHWHLHYSQEDRQPFALEPEAMIARRRRVIVSGAEVPTFDPVDTLLTLAFHAARSDGHRLVWFKDIERSIAVEAPDLDQLVRRCRAARCAPPVGLMLARARDVVDAEIPVEIITALTPAPLRGADRVVSLLEHPVQMHERGTASRLYARSVRSSTAATMSYVPARGYRLARRYLNPPRPNETDDPDEKASYLQAVLDSMQG